MEHGETALLGVPSPTSGRAWVLTGLAVASRAWTALLSWLSPNQQLGSRDASLDILRGVAILLVLMHHMPGFGLDIRNPLDWPALPWARVGWTGVDLFFVLSGFLVGGLLIREMLTRGRLDAGRFLVRRGLKIWPPYLIYLLTTVWVPTQTGEMGSLGASLWSLRANWVHLQNYVFRLGHVPGEWTLLTPRSHTWSLAVEEHFYLALTGLVPWASGQARLRKRHAMSWVPFVVLGTTVVCLAARVGLWWLSPTSSWQRWYYPSHLRVDGLMWGVGLAWVYHCQANRMEGWGRHWRWLMLTGVLMLAPFAIWTNQARGVHVFGLTAVYLAYGLILVAFLEGHKRSRRWTVFVRSVPGRALAWIGFYSYSIYLWHVDLAQMPSRRIVVGQLLHFIPGGIGLRTTANLGVYLLLAVVGGAVVGRLIETPFLAWRDRLFPSRSTALTLGARN